MHVMSRDELLKMELEHLRDEHRDLDAAIHAMQGRPAPDLLAIGRMKKRKLSLKDRIQRIEDQLTPDIIA